MTKAQILAWIYRYNTWRYDFKKELQDAQGGIPDDPKVIVLRDGEVYINIKEILG